MHASTEKKAGVEIILKQGTVFACHLAARSLKKQMFFAVQCNERTSLGHVVGLFAEMFCVNPESSDGWSLYKRFFDGFYI